MLPRALLVALVACKPSPEPAGTVPPPPVTDTGSPTDTDVPTTPPAPPDVVLITELHYHPVLEEAYDDEHEFLELFNPGDTPVVLDGWTVEGVQAFSLTGSVLAPGAFLVVAKDPTALLAVPSYALTADQVVGPYAGQLSNDGEKVSVVRPDGTRSDEVGYSDAFPWPIAADGLGAGEAWLDPALLPLEDHRDLGISLQRVSLSVDGDEPANWEPSAIDAATPGAPYAGLRDEPRPILEAHTATSLDGAVIGADDEVQLDLVFSTFGSLADASVEVFVDDVAVTGEPLEVFPVDPADLADRQVSVTLPGQPANAIVRYRVVADRGDGPEVVSPRPSDPMAFHAYFVDPEVGGNTRPYHLFLAPDEWTRMWTNIEAGRELGCEANPTWNDQVPGVFVYDGHVYDVRVRYQGSRYNRRNGAPVTAWPYPGPSAPSPMLGLSYRIGFSRYDRFEGRDAIALNKLTQSCPGLTAGVGFELFRQAGLPAATTRYARLFINGGYYRYMLEIEHPGEEMMTAWQAADAAVQGLAEPDPVGHLYKSTGLAGDAGPFGWGDARPLVESCGHAAYDRYATTYERKTWTWETHDPIIQMIEDLDAFRAPDGTVDVAGTRAYLDANFDVDRMLDHLALMNWSVPFDDYFQNYFLYQRRSDGRWMMVPWDIDLNWGEWADQCGGGAESSIWGGRNGTLVPGGIDANRSGWWNRIKDSFLVAYEDEFIDRIKLRNEDVLHPANIALALFLAQLDYDEAEADAAASPPDCDMAAEAAAMQAFADERYLYIGTTDPADLVPW